VAEDPILCDQNRGESLAVLEKEGVMAHTEAHEDIKDGNGKNIWPSTTHATQAVWK
jgi:hypothetical protein